MRRNGTASKALFYRAAALTFFIILLMAGEPAWATPVARKASNTPLRQNFVLNPIADAFTRASSPNSNYGTATYLRMKIDAYQLYLKFNVSGLDGPVQSAKLRIFLYDGSGTGGSVYAVSNNYSGTTTPWQESGINWNNAPVISGTPLSTVTVATANTWLEWDVTAAITGNGIISFGLSTTNGSSNYHHSKEAAIAIPELVIVTSTTTGNPPVANNDAASTNEDAQVAIDILANDSDSDGTLDPASVTIANQPANGTISNINPATGVVTYSPNANYYGSDVFTYTVKDNTGASSNAATVAVTVNPVNDAPLANNDVATAIQNNAVDIDVLANDSDIDGTLAPASVAIVNPPANGSISGINSSTGKITYAPNAGFSGQDNFTYTVQDNSGAVSNQAAVAVTVGAPPPPVSVFYPVADAYVASSNPGSNYGKSKELRAEQTSTSKYNSYLKFTITGLAGSVASAKLRLYTTSASDDGGKVYSVSNNYNSTGTAWLETGLNWSNAPAITGTPISQVGAIGLNIWFEFDVTSAISGDGSYSFAISNSSKDAVKYSSKEGSQKPELVIATGTVTGNPPVANNDAAGTNEDTQVSINILANDSDADGTLNPASVVITSQPINGTISNINPANGAVTYAPKVNFFGADVYSYTVKDNQGMTSNAATVTITVNPVNDAPVASDDAITTATDVSVQIPVLANDSDPDGSIDPSTLTITDSPFRGVISAINPATGVVTYLPNAGYQGTDFFRYTVKDQLGAISNVATVSITVQNAAGDVLIFSAMGDVPYTSSEVPTLLRHIADHNQYSPSEFMVHVGDIKDGSSSNCTESVYSDMFDYLRGMQVPTFIVPGDNEWNDCANPAQAWAYWEQYFTDFEQNFNGVPIVERQSGRHENFAFVKKGVLIIGLNMPAGTKISGWDARLQDNANWVSQQLQSKKSEVRAAVIFAQAGPGGSKNTLFFNQFETAAAIFNEPILFLHGDGHSWTMDRPFSNQKIQRIQVNKGGREEPVEISVLFNPQNMFIAQRNPLSGYKNVTETPAGLLTVTTEGLGKVELSPPGGMYEPGTVVTLRANAAPGYRFMYWDGDLNGANNPETITVDSNKNLKAVFRTQGPSGIVVHEETKTGLSSFGAAVVSGELIAVENDLYLAAIASKPTTTVSTVSGLGLNWMRLTSQCSGGNSTGVEVWWAQGTPDKNGRVTAIFAEPTSNATLAVSRYSGVDKTNPIGNLISGNSNGLAGECSGGAPSGDYSFAIEAVANGSIVYSAAATDDETHTAGIGFTERADITAGTDTTAAGIAVQDQIIPTATTIAVQGTFSSTGTDWAVIAFGIRPQQGVAKSAYQQIDAVDVSEVPVMYQLHQNFPNPFNPSTIIKFSLPEYAKVTIKVFSLDGRHVLTLVDGFFPAGIHSIPFRPEKIGSGVYIYELHAGEVKQARRLIYLK